MVGGFREVLLYYEHILSLYLCAVVVVSVAKPPTKSPSLPVLTCVYITMFSLQKPQSEPHVQLLLRHGAMCHISSSGESFCAGQDRIQ